MAELPLIWTSIIRAKRFIHKNALRSSNKNDLNKNRASTHEHFEDDEITEKWIVTRILSPCNPISVPVSR